VTRLRCALVVASCAAALSSGCGSSGGSSSSGTTAAVASALSAEARSAATGDIPDNQVFLVFGNRAARYSIKYPEGWTRSGAGNDVTFRDKNNVVHITIAAGPAPTPASVTTSLQALRGSTSSLTFTPPNTLNLPSGAAVKATYTTRSAPDPVTGRSVLLVVDRYTLGRAGRVATVDLGSPQGVDNVDAYRMMIESFRWE
jgi:hypothetical protein